MRKYTKEQLLFYLKRLASELKRSPTIKDINKSEECPSANTYLKRFNGWNNSLKIAGLKINVRKSYDKKELIENLKQLAKELGRVPKPKDLKGKKWAASYATYRKYFGSWKEALKTAGINKTGRAISLKEYVKRKQI